MSRTEHEEHMFYCYCRQPKTRINDIMTLIESGFTDEEIAAIVGTKKANGILDTSASDIAVYRKVLHGDLCRLATWEDPMENRLQRGYQV